MMKKKILFRLLVSLAALLIVALGAAFTLLTFSYLELNAVSGDLTPGYINALPEEDPRRITIEPEFSSYPRGTKEINLIVSGPSGVGFVSDDYYLITKENYLFKIWPTRLSETLGGRRGDAQQRFGAEPSENGEPVTLTCRLNLEDWSWQPTRGTYTYTTAVYVEINGVSTEYLLSCRFTIE